MSATDPAAKKSRYLLTDWNPNDESKWDSKLAWRTLWITTYSLILAFCVWFLPSAIAPKLTALGFNLDKSQLYWLTALPGLAAGILRLIYMFLPPLIGTRKLVGITSLLCIIPMVGWFYVVQDNTTPYWVLLTLAFMCGIGGGAFSGYMPSTGYFFPKRLSGTALGLQGGIGNLGMSVILLVGPVLMGFGLFGLTWLAPQQQVAGDHVGESIWVYNAAIFFVPWCILAAILAFVWLRDVPVKANIKQQLDIFSNPNTWYMTILYVMTFGLFSGFSAVFALLINNQFGAQSALTPGRHGRDLRVPRPPHRLAHPHVLGHLLRPHGRRHLDLHLRRRHGDHHGRHRLGSDQPHRYRPTSTSSWASCSPCSCSPASVTPVPSSRCR